MKLVDEVTEVKISKEIEDRFASHKINNATMDKLFELRKETVNLAKHIAALCPDSREKSLALTKLEECGMWTTKCLSRKR